MFLTQLLLRSGVMSVLTLCFLGAARLAGPSYAAKWRCRTWYVLLAGFLLPLPTFSAPAVAVAPVFTAAPATQPDRFPLLPFLLLWLAGAFAVLFVTLLRHLRFLRAVRRCSVRRGKLWVTPLISSPLTVGLFRPRILLPDAAYSKAELRWILRHELAHIRRRDNLFRLFLCLCKAVHWFNPAVWLLLRAAAQDCEEACDAAALQNAAPAERQDYCATLLRIAAGEKPSTALAAPLCRSAADLKRRLSAALYGGTRRPLRGVTVLAATLALCGGLIIGVSGASAELFRRSESAATDFSKIDVEYTTYVELENDLPAMEPAAYRAEETDTTSTYAP